MRSWWFVMTKPQCLLWLMCSHLSSSLCFHPVHWQTLTVFRCEKALLVGENLDLTGAIWVVFFFTTVPALRLGGFVVKYNNSNFSFKCIFFKVGTIPEVPGQTFPLGSETRSRLQGGGEQALIRVAVQYLYSVVTLHYIILVVFSSHLQVIFTDLALLTHTHTHGSHCVMNQFVHIRS